MADIFISYAHEDLGVVHELVRLLERRGMSVWWDHAISIGRDLNEAIDAQLEAASAVIVVWSAASVGSMWVRGEAAEALAAEKLVPVIVGPVRIPIPFSLCETADLQGWPSQSRHKAVTRLLRRIEAMVSGGRAAGAPVAETPRMRLECALADAALLTLEGSTWKPAPDGLLTVLSECVAGGHVVAWDDNELLWGDLVPDLLIGEDAATISARLDAHDDGWSFVAVDDGVGLWVSKADVEPPPTWLSDRLHSVQRLLVHWRQRQRRR